VIDSYVFAGANVEPAWVDVAVRWEATGPPENLGSGDTVDPADPAAFLGTFAPAEATAQISGRQLGFKFRSDPGLSTDQGYAEIGTERNGSFL
jgi:hypothetical protein